MATDYVALRKENERRYGTDIGRIGPVLLANRYDDRTHFIFELLQNAEDALTRRQRWEGRRAVEFALSQQSLCISHFGIPFTNEDVRGICGIGESEKGDLRFGIGFKSVYAFTDCPQIHSGEEHFAIESFVWPKAITPITSEAEQTLLFLPLREDDPSAMSEITVGLKRLGPRTLLFLSEIEEISWSLEGAPSGLYRRGKPELLGKNARKVVLISEDRTTQTVSEESWLIFSREVSMPKEGDVGYVEIAFFLGREGNDEGLFVRPLDSSPLVVSFPTILPTNLGFLVQGPYRATPSRDNVMIHDTWNKHLVTETATLLVEALQELSEFGLLNVQALLSLPLESSKFPEGSMFAPLFIAVREAFSNLQLLPRFHGGYVSAKHAKLARTKDVRELFSPLQLTTLLGADQEISWLSEEITDKRTPELRRYLMNELGIAEFVLEQLIPRLTKQFLEEQPDSWIVQLYKTLHGQITLFGRLTDIPLIRLEGGHHVTPIKNGHLQAFLPGPVPTDFPTVRRSVCQSNDALAFLRELGLSEPDPVDDVIANVLPKYEQSNVQIEDAEYKRDVGKLLKAFSTDSTKQRNKLIENLRNACFIRAVNTGDGSRLFVRPGEVYQATERLKALFSGVSGVLIVDDRCECLRGENVRDLLEACGAALYLQPIAVNASLSSDQKVKIRKKVGMQKMSYDHEPQDFMLRGLESLLQILPDLPADQARARATLLWQALCDVADRRGTSVFSGTYRWFYLKDYKGPFDANFVQVLNESVWVPAINGELQRPAYVVFEDIALSWNNNPFLLSKIKFKPPILHELAREAGIDPGVLDLLKKQGITNEAELRERLGIENDSVQTNRQAHSDDSEEKTWEPEHEPDSVNVITTEADPDKIVTPDLTGQAEKMVTEKEDKLSNKDDETIEEDMPKNQPDLKAIGSWGEKCVYLKELRENYQKLGSITETDSGFKVINVSNEEFEIVWLNKHRDRGKGYDFVIKKNGNEIEYIEVKTKIQPKGVKELVRVTGTQWEFARKLFEQNEGEKYHFYVVSNAGKENIPIEILKNPIKLWKEGKLYAHPVKFEL